MLDWWNTGMIGFEKCSYDLMGLIILGSKIVLR